MAYCGQATPANASFLASKTGLDPLVALAWLKNECQSVANPTNPLNILYYGTNGQIGKQGRFGTYSSTQAGLQAAANLVNNSGHYAGIRSAIKSGDAKAEARAIELSPWAGGNYGATSSKLGGISKTYQGLLGKPIDWASYLSDTASSAADAATANILSILKKSNVSTDPSHTLDLAEVTRITKFLPIGNDWVGRTVGDLINSFKTQPDNGFLGIPGALQAVGTQLQDTGTWIGFIFVGIAILILGGLLTIGSVVKE